ncbi:MAG: hypothetical protein OER86_13210, partial [Phycisphaerae bacterium]|nr:hypothetical protein [Phycisphaerae bacterium]
MVFSSRHMIVFAALALGLTGRLSAAVDPALVNEYRQRWIERERDTAMEADRIQLARDLYAAAKGHVSRPMKILLLHKSYEWGRRDFPGGYYHASRALQLIQRTDARQRTACLEKLAALFQDAWSRGRRTR